MCLRLFRVRKLIGGRECILRGSAAGSRSACLALSLFLRDKGVRREREPERDAT
jgi:hypothetical protein